MRVLASHAVEPFIPYGKYQPSPRLFAVAPVSVTHSDGALLQRKSNCACGGDCPSCVEESAAETVQTKLTVSRPGDQYEQEADRMADYVMSMPAQNNPGMTRVNDRSVPTISRHSLPGVPHSNNVPSVVHDVLRSAGQQLDPATRAFMESRFKRDFSQVRIHNDSQAAESARGVRASAYTVGRNLVFGAGHYLPTSDIGLRLLAHELTHVVQQSEDSTPAHLQREEASATETPGACNIVDVFSELDPGALLPSAYFRNGNALFDDKKKSAKGHFNSELEASKKGKCAINANFPDITLKWNLGNPKLGSWYTKNLNDDSKDVDINNIVIYSRTPCCGCFSGSLTWLMNVTGSRVFNRGTKTERTETGKTAAPLAGTKKIGDCTGTECCSVNRKFPITLWLGDADVSLDFIGTILLSGKIFNQIS